MLDGLFGPPLPMRQGLLDNGLSASEIRQGLLMGPAPIAARPMDNRDLLAELLRRQPVGAAEGGASPIDGQPMFVPQSVQSADGREMAPMPRSFGEAGQRMSAVLRGDVEPTPGEQMGMNVVRGFTEGPASIRAFHGSPHKFDRFDISRIGTGDGAQAYGHGLYFAGNEGVARSYKGKDGGIYEVNLNTNPEKLLDFNLPLNEQPQAIQEAFNKAAPDIMKYWKTIIGKAGDSGGFQYRILAEKLANDVIGGWRSGAPAASERLRAAGIDGIQYHEPGSLEALKGGPRNYVMFDDKLIDIMRRYGLAGLMALGASQTDFQPQSEQQ